MREFSGERNRINWYIRVPWNGFSKIVFRLTSEWICRGHELKICFEYRSCLYGIIEKYYIRIIKHTRFYLKTQKFAYALNKATTKLKIQ